MPRMKHKNIFVQNHGIYLPTTEETTFDTIDQCLHGFSYTCFRLCRTLANSLSALLLAFAISFSPMWMFFFLYKLHQELELCWKDNSSLYGSGALTVLSSFFFWDAVRVKWSTLSATVWLATTSSPPPPSKIYEVCERLPKLSSDRNGWKNFPHCCGYPLRECKVFSWTSIMFVRVLVRDAFSNLVLVHPGYFIFLVPLISDEIFPIHRQGRHLMRDNILKNSFLPTQSFL